MDAFSASSLALNGLSACVLAVLLTCCARTQDRVFLGSRIFLWLVLLTLSLVGLDAAIILTSAAPASGHSGLPSVLNALFFTLNDGPLFLFYLFLDFHVHGNPGRSRKILRALGAVWAVTALVSLMSPLTGLLFSYSPEGDYRRGPLFVPYAALSYGILAFSLGAAWKNRRLIERRSLLPLLLFPLPTVLGGTVQLLIPSLSLMWSGGTLTLLVIYLHLQNERMHRDYLTGAWNRRFLDEWLEHRLSLGNPQISGLFMDLDGFKALNDTFGHETGDEALRITVSILRSCVHGSDFLARYAGDEFVVILDTSSPGTITRVVSRIEDEIERFNQGGSRSYPLSLSIGAAIYSEDLDGSGDRFLKRLDAAMYSRKQAKKRSAAASRPGKEGL